MTMQTIKWIITTCMSFCIASCNYLGSVNDIQPDFVLTDKNVITDAQSAEFLLNGINTYYRSSEFVSMRSALLLCSGELKNTNVVQGANDFKNNTLRPNNITVANYYNVLYTIINQANSFIRILSPVQPKGLTEQRKKEMLAEAYFHKAFAEFMLLRSYGEFWNLDSEYGIVLYENPVRNNEETKPRSGVKAAYDKILEDLDKAEDAPAYSGQTYHISRLTVKALRARVLLAEGRYQEAEQAATQAIELAAGSGVTLTPDYVAAYADGYASAEVIYAPYVSYPKEKLSSTVVNDYQYSGFGETISLIADQLSGESDDDQYDLRYTSSFLTAGTQAQSQKYVSYSAEGADLNTYYLFRLPELYYIKAEALVRTRQADEARGVLAEVLQRSGYTMADVEAVPESELILYIFKQKYMEMALENGEPWFDMIRLHFKDKLDFTKAPTQYVRAMTHPIFPIPETAIAGNNLLKQNPTYKN